MAQPMPGGQGLPQDRARARGRVTRAASHCILVQPACDSLAGCQPVVVDLDPGLISGSLAPYCPGTSIMYRLYMSHDMRHPECNCSAEHLEPALDRFAQFFVAPLISEDGIEREVKAVDSECAPPLFRRYRAPQYARISHPTSNSF